MKVAISQMCSSNSLTNNLALMEEHIAKAAGSGATIIVFPEFAYFIGKSKEEALIISRYEEVVSIFCAWSKKYKITIVPGTLREPAKDGKFFNTLITINSEGEIICKYRKVFLYKANLPDGKFDESRNCVPGNEIMTFVHDDLIFGASICFDIRFPEFYRRLKSLGAHVVLIPASFPVYTGRAHWDLLTRIRAVENQVFILAPAQVGILGSGLKSYGHSRIVSPWGDVLAEITDSQDVAFALLDLKLILEAQNKIDLWASRRDDLFFY